MTWLQERGALRVHLVLFGLSLEGGAALNGPHRPALSDIAAVRTPAKWQPTREVPVQPDAAMLKLCPR